MLRRRRQQQQEDNKKKKTVLFFINPSSPSWPFNRANTAVEYGRKYGRRREKKPPPKRFKTLFETSFFRKTVKHHYWTIDVRRTSARRLNSTVWSAMSLLPVVPDRTPRWRRRFFHSLKLLLIFTNSWNSNSSRTRVSRNALLKNNSATIFLLTCIVIRLKTRVRFL